MNETIQIPVDICSAIFITENKQFKGKKLYLDSSGVSRFILGSKDKDIIVRDGVITITWIHIKRKIVFKILEDRNFLVLEAINGINSYIKPIYESETIQLTYNS